MNIKDIAHFREKFAIASLGVAAVVGSFNYQTDGFFSWLTGPSFTNFRPDLLAGLVALLLVVPVVRGDFLHNHKVDLLNVVMLLLAFYVAAVLVRIGLGDATSWRSVPATYFVAAVLFLINLNPKKYGEIAIVGLVMCATLNLIVANNTMNEWGFVLLVSATIGSALVVDLQKIMNSIRIQKNSA